MVVDQNFHKLKKFLFFLVLFISVPLNSFAKQFDFKKIINLEAPWGSSFINDKELIVTEKSGKIKLINIINNSVSEISHNLNFLEYGQGGLLDILYNDNYIYISYTENRNNFKTSTSIARAVLNKKRLEFENIFQANPPIDSPYHFGSRLAIKGDHLFASAGERGEGMIAQDTKKHPGSIIRININAENY